MKKEPSRGSPLTREKEAVVAENLGFLVGWERKEGKSKHGGFKCPFEYLICLWKKLGFWRNPI